jgi:hypothetical protein
MASSSSGTNKVQLVSFFVLGMPSWALVNGTWAALASLAENVPEGYNISAYLILSLTLGNFLPFYLGQKSYLFSKRELAKVMYAIQIVGFTAGILMAFFWDDSVTIGSYELSLPLFLLFFVVGACSASTSVTYFTYVAKYSPLCTTYISTGMGAGSFLAGLFALVQTNLFPAKKYVDVLFGLVSCMFIPAFVALFVLEQEDIAREAAVKVHAVVSSPKFGVVSPLKGPKSPKSAKDAVIKKRIVDSVDFDGDNDVEESIDTYVEDDANTRHLNKFEEWNVVRANLSLLIFVGIASFLGHGLVPTIISSVAGRFKKSALTLSFATGEAAMVDPIFRFYTAYFRFESLTQIHRATYMLIFLSLCMLSLQFLPSTFVLFTDPLGGLSMVTLNVLFVTLFVFTNTSSFLYFKENVPERLIGYAYKWNGLSIQIGAVAGSLLSVLLFMLGVTSGVI